MSGVSPEGEPERTSADQSELVGSRPTIVAAKSGARIAPLVDKEWGQCEPRARGSRPFSTL